MQKLGIVADDLTGAMDTGVQLAEWDLDTVLVLGDSELSSAEVLVISTDSRHVGSAEAYRRTKEVGLRLRDRIVYKKIDSTLRGNVGPELDALLDALKLERALVAPAFPEAGRTTVDGHHAVYGKLLSESSFARDPLWPATESHVPALLSGETHRMVGHLSLSIVERGEEAVAEALGAEVASIVVADAAERRHLRTLVLALARMGDRWLPCGSAGLAECWPLAFGVERTRERTPRWSSDSHPVLVVAGSRHEATARQLQQAVQDGNLALVDLLVGGNWRGVIQGKAVPLLNRGRNVALTTTFSEYREGKEAAIADVLARSTVETLMSAKVAGLMMTGGDVARAVCRAAQARALRIVGAVQHGVPAGRLLHGPYDGLRVVTKAGSFGDDSVVSQSIDYIQGALVSG